MEMKTYKRRQKKKSASEPGDVLSAHPIPFSTGHGEEEVLQAEQADVLTQFICISHNEFVGRKQKKLKEEDIAVCECKYNASNPESACGESCLNVLTNTECTPGYCPCNEYCKNQKFQKSNYAKTKLCKTEGRGWGLLADEHIKAGQFIIEYCGEVISAEEAQQRSQTYEDQALKHAYIISLDANDLIDATKKGSLARFINHSCQPNCETRKWTVLGNTRVGIFAKYDISVGTELAYDYNFEWYGGDNVPCLCGATNCSKFLGAKSHGFQEYNHLWEEGDDRYTVEDVPLYDSAEDEPFPVRPVYTASPSTQETVDYSGMVTENIDKTEIKFEATKDNPDSIHETTEKSLENESNQQTGFSFEQSGQTVSQTNPMMPRIRSNGASRNSNIGSGPSLKNRAPNTPKPRGKTSGKKYVSSKPVAQLFASKEAREEITMYEEQKKNANAGLKSVYDEIRPVIEERERDSQDSVPTSVADKWIASQCESWKADFLYHFSIVKNVMCPKPADPPEAAKPSDDGNEETKNPTNEQL